MQEIEDVVLKVRDLMTKNFISVKAGESVRDAALLMAEKGISSILVKGGSDFLGIVTDRDIISRVVSKGVDPIKVNVIEVMSSPLITISAEATLEEAAEKMRKNKIRRLVVEEAHQKLGIITETDMVRVDPELHFLIREHSKLEGQLNPTEPQEVIFAGFYEECGNYSPDLQNVNGEWLCEDCRG